MNLQKIQQNIFEPSLILQTVSDIPSMTDAKSGK